MVRHLTCFGVAHPLAGAFVDHLRPIAGAAVDPAALHLSFRSDEAPWRGGPGERAFHLELDGVDGLELAACWSPSAAAILTGFNSDCRRLAQAHPVLPTLSLKAALQSPVAIAAFLTDLLGVSLSQAAVLSAERGHSALRRACMPFLHPMAFLEAIGPFQEISTRAPSTPAPDPGERFAADRARREAGSTLVITGGNDAAFENVASAAPDIFQIIALPQRHALEDLDRRDSSAFDLIWFDRIDGRNDLEGLLPWARRRLTAAGVMAGTERSSTSAIRMLSRFTASDGTLYCRVDDGQWEVVTPPPPVLA